ncbi:MAG: hypothetical protein A2527_03460 [Candidatus Lambdaproteobacteria bacterium RIFOXYD2_FULL_50_16]|uniref:TerB family tellurite resistance protein n=1 Tax=Candidatus Lambdaproteobacteria bacterium RIFOXYD2_FULL_50_16 TaxID=1817772 RepID=A0A1F6GEV1_9PROT|nr:MAG: hypothetical protein A2527_03460 [Candidatus Lambdaproteobacteria bacterium RIFOXYD2_FULL_50_16]
METIKKLEEKHKFWFATAAIQLIWADGDLSIREFEQFSRVTELFSDTATQKKLVTILESGKISLAEVPADIPQSALADIYLELLTFAISDWDLGDAEKDYLERLAVRLNFTKPYRAKLFRWANQGMTWQRKQRNFLPPGVEVDACVVPVGDYDERQKYWYAQVLVSAILLDGIVSGEQFEPLKNAVSFLKHPKLKASLLTQIKNNVKVKLSAPPSIPLDGLYVIFFEVLRMFGADDSLSIKETSFIQNYIRTTQLPEKLISLGVEWCQTGINWRKEKAVLAKQVEFNQVGSSLSMSADRWLLHSKNSSLMYRKQTCWLCGCADVTVRQLKPKSQKPRSNIFGVPIYGTAISAGEKGLDFHKLAINFCPTCGFASNSRHHFKTSEDTKALEPLENEDFKLLWKRVSAKQKSIIAQLVAEPESTSPSWEYVQDSYRLALETLECFNQFKYDLSTQWRKANLLLVLAQLQSAQGLGSEADNTLEEIRLIAKEVMENAREDALTLSAAQFLFSEGLYREDNNTAMEYYNFFQVMKNEHFEEMDPQGKKRFSGMFNQVNKVFQDRSFYAKNKLKGLELPD